MPLILYTIGHSTHPLASFIDLLKSHEIAALGDIRRFPSSRKFPHFNREDLSAALAHSGIEYHWLEALGGRRGKTKQQDSPNAGLRNESFRNYADYMATTAFQTGIAQLLEIAARKRTAYMCSESVFWRCHRRLVSDYLLAQGISVEHIMPSGELRPHTLTSGAVIRDGKVTYPSADNEPRLFY
jgi:uncharacterized protein (DUF488 family)